MVAVEVRERSRYGLLMVAIYKNLGYGYELVASLTCLLLLVSAAPSAPLLIPEDVDEDKKDLIGN